MKTSSASLTTVEDHFDEFTKAFARKPTRRRTLQMLSGGFLGTFLGLRGPRAWAASTTSAVPAPGGVEEARAATAASNLPVVCPNQDYALCAGVQCFVYNAVAYCKCSVMSGNSVSSPLNYSGGNVCNFNGEGPRSGYMVSTFSLPTENQSLYFCPPSRNSGYYASCDGGVCFTSSRGQSFPGLGQLGGNEIVCACTIKDGSMDLLGHQIFGPSKCNTTFFQNCSKSTATGANGSYLFEAAPTGNYEIGAFALNHVPAHFNMCLS
jgi:hypothetical protein